MMEIKIFLYYIFVSIVFLLIVPIIKNKLMQNFVETKSVKKQTFIIMGIMLIISIILGLSVSKYFFIFTMFMGTGLIYYGITGFCMLSIIVSKIHRNKKHMVHS